MQLRLNGSTIIPFPITPWQDSPLETLIWPSFHFLSRLSETPSLTQIEAVWCRVRSKAIAPVLQLAVIMSLAMSVVLLIDIASMGAISLAVKFLGHRPDKRYKWEPINSDLEQGSSAYPMVIVQIPMYNEKEVIFYTLFIFFFFFLKKKTFRTLDAVLGKVDLWRRFTSFQLVQLAGFPGRWIEFLYKFWMIPRI